jgi:hypothetical protein
MSHVDLVITVALAYVVLIAVHVTSATPDRRR